MCVWGGTDTAEIGLCDRKTEKVCVCGGVQILQK